jgi:uncharacterized protein YndB with AHSA1/START domain
MSVKTDAAGRRYVEAEVEVPGAPEEVWEAIATGPGVSSWFVPTEMRDDGAVVARFGPGMEAVARRTSWDPPRRFTAQGEGFGPGAPPIATEWTVEARAGGTCVVRVVHSLFTNSEDWDDQLDAIESGWPDFFRILRLYLTRFPGQHGATIQVAGVTAAPPAEAWRRLTEALGLDAGPAGERRRAPASVPPLSGRLEAAGEGAHHQQRLLTLEEPTTGIAHVYAMPMGPQVVIMMRLYLYGDRAAAIAERDEPRWQAWMAARFPLREHATTVEEEAR